MRKILISISSCQAYEDAGLNQPLRDTWLPDAVKLGMDYRFFHGLGATPKDDIVVLPVHDGLGGLTEKAKFKARWACENDYDYVFSCFPDLYARAERLLATGFGLCDYLGNVYQHPKGPPFCQGGPGYFLSRKACETIARDTTSYLNDDCWVADVLLRNGVSPTDCRDFTYCGPGPLRGNTSATNHLSTQPGGYTAAGLYAEHKRWLES
jgi:hypothetical protein